MIEAAWTVVPTSKYQIKDYSTEIHGAAEARLQLDETVTGLVQAD